MAIRSTAKEAKQAIRAYILTHANDLDELGYDDGDDSIARPSDPANIKEVSRMILDVFRLEYGWAVRRMGEYNALKSWMRGLPSILFTLPLCTYREAHDLVKSWLQQSDAEAARYADTDATETALHLVARELLACGR